VGDLTVLRASKVTQEVTTSAQAAEAASRASLVVQLFKLFGALLG
ncbi:hypothetical protein HaLaN_12532, partial [Haematococcus lacustris]